MFIQLMTTMRPRQWSKNLILFAGIIFSHELLDIPMLIKVILAFAIFCILSGVVYIINDLKDLESDRIHPQKRNRRQRKYDSGRS